MNKARLGGLLLVGTVVFVGITAGVSLSAVADGAPAAPTRASVAQQSERIRVVDREAGVVCYIDQQVGGGGIDCLPLSETAIGGDGVGVTAPESTAGEQFRIDGGRLAGQVSREVVERDRVVCYTVDLVGGGGIDCLPLTATALGDVAGEVVFAGNLTIGDRPTGNLTLELPSGPYVVGSRVTLSGDSPDAVSTVALYVRTPDGWQLLDLDHDGTRSIRDVVSVGPDGRWRTERVVLSTSSTVLAKPGAHRIGVVPLSDATSPDGVLRTEIPPDVFSDLRAETAVLAVQSPVDEESRMFGDVNGEVAIEDRYVDVNGLAPGSQEVLVTVVDSRGKVATDVVGVDGDVVEAKFELRRSDGTPLDEGFAVGIVLSAGPDDLVGNGDIQGVGGADLAALAEYIRERTEATSLLQRQVLEILRAETVADAGSDDVRFVDTFVITDAQVTIDAVFPAAASNRSGIRRIERGETVVVRGTTNRRPGDNTVSVDVFEVTNRSRVASADTDEWGGQGIWTTTFDTATLEPGTYIVQAGDGDDSDSVRVSVVEPDPAKDTSRATPATEPRIGSPSETFRFTRRSSSIE